MNVRLERGDEGEGGERDGEMKKWNLDMVHVRGEEFQMFRYVMVMGFKSLETCDSCLVVFIS